MKVAFVLSDLRGGGVQRMVVILAGALAERGADVDLVVYEPGGPLRDAIPANVRISELARANPIRARLTALCADPQAWPALRGPLLRIGKRRWKSIVYLPALTRHLRATAPDAIFAASPYVNIEAVLARRAAGLDARLVVSERTHFSAGKEKKVWQQRHLAPLMRRAYDQADVITAVSHGVADDLAATLDLPRARITVLHNPTLTPNFDERASAPVEHPWFADASVPVVVAVGRVAPQKDFDTLLRAFARVLAKRPARLAIVGPGKESAVRRLRALADELGVAEHLALLGFQPNPLRYLSRAALFVLSSRFEGFPNVVLEALGCGTPVVSTDCPSGPREILDDGKYGALVPVGDAAALADAMLRSLEAPPPREALRARASVFDYPTAIARYTEVLLGEADPAS